MTIVLLIILLLVTIAMVGVILMQRSEGGALGIGGGPGGMMSGAGAANLLTRTTMILGIIFMGVCIVLAIMSGADTRNQSVTDQLVEESGALSPFDFDALPDDETAPADEVPADDVPAEDPPAADEPEVPGR
jgi:preprotein translocase subunit SecG